MEKIIFDTDPGIDDAMALLLIHSMQDLDVMGITTVFGNASIDACTRNALYICERFGLPYSVHEGACLLYTSPSPRDRTRSRMPSSA